MGEDVGSYSNVANINRVAAGLKGNPGRLQNANPSPSFTFTDGVPPGAAKANTSVSSEADNKIVDPWVNRRPNSSMK